MNKKYIAISGSIREKSLNGMLLQAAKENAKEIAEIEIVTIGNLPLYNADLEQDFPEVVKELQNKIIASDGIIFATPEYNRSVPGVLKNAIDWISRPYGSNICAGKKALVLGATTGNTGTAVAQSHLKQILLALDMQVLGQPEFYLSFAQEKFDEEGNLTDEKTKEKIIKALEVLVK